MLSSAALDLSLIDVAGSFHGAQPDRASHAPTRAAQIARPSYATDPELVRRALLGDAAAETAIVQRYSADLRALAKRMLADGEEANDIVQETFMRAFQAWSQLKEPARLKGWLSSIAFRLAHRRFRAKKAARAAGACFNVDEATIEAVASADCSSETLAEFALLARRLGRFSTELRRAWLLHQFEGLPLDLVARECGCSESTVKRRIAKTRRILDAFVAPRRI